MKRLALFFYPDMGAEMTTSKHLSSKILIPLGISIIAIPVGFIGCNGGSSSGGGATADITTAAVDEALTWVNDTIPGCRRTDPAAATVAEAGKTAAWSIGALTEVFTLLADARKLSSGQATIPARQTFVGDCGGTLDVDSVHLNGITTYTLTFNNFCSTDNSSPTPLLSAATGPQESAATGPQQSTATGIVIAKQIGTPGASGPLVTSGTMTTDELTVVTGTETMKLAMNNAAVTYGVPGTWEPGIPTAANPDQVTIDRVTANLESQDRIHTLTNVTASAHESGVNAIVNITGGRYATTSHGQVNIATSVPLVGNMTTGQITAGTLTLTGAAGSMAEVTASGTGDGTATVTVNGVPYGSGLDCSGAQGFLGLLL